MYRFAYVPQLYNKQQHYILTTPVYAISRSILTLSVYKKILNKTIRNAKRSYYASLFEKSKTSAKDTWSAIKMIMTTEADVAKLNLVHRCESCTREFTKLRGLKMHMARWCDGGRTQRSRVGSLTDKAVKSSKRRAAEASLDKVAIGSDPPLENVPHFQYLGSRLQGDGSDEADVGHRLEIAQSAFSTLSHLWADHRLSRTTKLRLYRVCVCSSLTHCCEAWTLNRAVTRTINGFNSRCLHVLTGEHYRETAIAPAYDLVLAVRRRRLRYLGHVLRMPAERMVRRALLALVSDSVMYPTGSLFSDCQGVALSQLVAMASSRSMWRARVASLL